MKHFKYPVNDYSPKEKNGCWPIIVGLMLFWIAVAAIVRFGEFVHWW